ncbi:MAG: glycosyltransferase family 2 protein [Cytophagales bacterium]|nr:glycosyltransferase family 2 protein [Cytophagales bacterium]
MEIKKLSIIIPVFNEQSTIRKILARIQAVKLIHNIEKEIVIVNDYATDQTEEEIFRYQKENPNLAIKYFRHEVNQGKGAALHTGIQHATGECLIIQDADLEYNPQEYNLLLQPMIEGFADVVYGSRFQGGQPHRVLFFWHTVGNKLLTFLSNLLTNLNLTDMETCYKLFKTTIIKKLTLKEKRFGFEPEVTSKVANVPGIKIYEVGISYYGRTYQEGKKINWKDGLNALYCIFKYGLFAKEE